MGSGISSILCYQKNFEFVHLFNLKMINSVSWSWQVMKKEGNNNMNEAQSEGTKLTHFTFRLEIRSSSPATATRHQAPRVKRIIMACNKSCDQGDPLDSMPRD